MEDDETAKITPITPGDLYRKQKNESNALKRTALINTTAEED
jgi:hypothetical protein